jgi:hypothetical protein
MLKLRSLLAAGVILSFAFGGALGASEAGKTQEALPTTGTATLVGEMGETEGYQCCWVLYMGRWYCIPC